MPFSLNWVFQRAAATAPMPSAPQTPGSAPRAPSPARFAGFSAGRATSGPQAAARASTSSGRLLDILRQRREQPGGFQRAEHREREPARARREAGSRRAPGRTGTPALGAPRREVPARGHHDRPAAALGRFTERRRASPPCCPSTTRRPRACAAPRARAAPAIDSPRPARRSRSRNTDRRTSPATADPPMPQNDHAAHVGEVGKTARTRHRSIPVAAMRADTRAATHRPGSWSRSAQHRPGRRSSVSRSGGAAWGFCRRILAPASGPGVPSGFSASSISITGMPSRTGYR